MGRLVAVADMQYGVPREGVLSAVSGRLRDYFLAADPTFWVAMVPAIALSAILYTRSLTTNFIFDEQEALLANPYVNGQNLRVVDVIHRDFWGLAADRSVGSYRPLHRAHHPHQDCVRALSVGLPLVQRDLARSERRAPGLPGLLRDPPPGFCLARRIDLRWLRRVDRSGGRRRRDG